jgi:multiple sugar transport system substrate-binding protein
MILMSKDYDTGEKITRRHYLKYVGGIVGAAAVAAAGYGIYEATKPPSEKVTIAILTQSAPEPLAATDKSILDLYKETHPNVDFIVDVVPVDTFMTLGMRELMERTGRYDLMIAPNYHEYKGLQLGSIYIEEDQGIVDPEMKAQVRKDVIARCSDPKTGKIAVWPPIFWNSMALFYRKDLLNDPKERDAFKAKYGYDLRPPQTWNELRDVAEFFTRPPDLYGFWTTGGVPWTIVCGEFWIWMQSMGGDALSWKDNSVTIKTDAWREALKFQKSLVKFSSPGWEGSDWFQGLKLFEEGKIAMHLQWYFPWADFIDPSKVAPAVLNNVGVVAPPKSPIGKSRGILSCDPIWLLLESSPHPNEATEFLKWFQKFDVQKKIALSGSIMVPARQDVSVDPEVDAKIHSKEIIQMPGLEEYEMTPTGTPLFDSKADLVISPLAEGYINYLTDKWDLETALDFMQNECEKIFATVTTTTA